MTVAAAGDPRSTLVPGLAPSTLDAAETRSTSSLVLRGMARALVNGVIFAALGLLLWEVLLKLSGITPFIAKSPGDVYHYLFTDPLAAAHRAVLNHAFWTTARDAAIGFVAGTAVAVVAANLFTVQPQTSQTLMPVAMTLRTVPLVAMVPLISLVFGRGLVAVAVVSGIVTFFPTLVNMTVALRSVPRESLDLMHGYGANRLTTLQKVQFPGSLPALFASARIAAPLALVGALLAEWLETASGIGFLEVTSTNQGDYTMVWASVVLVVVASVVLYSVISGVEALVLTRYAPGQNRQVI
jgi:ABC-type nitrate/sulfonate/bicarbonate transport system permease component